MNFYQCEINHDKPSRSLYLFSAPGGLEEASGCQWRCWLVSELPLLLSGSSVLQVQVEPGQLMQEWNFLLKSPAEEYCVQLKKKKRKKKEKKNVMMILRGRVVCLKKAVRGL